MKTSTRILSISAAVLALGAGGLAFAQASQGPMGMHQGMGMHGGSHDGNGGGMHGGMQGGAHDGKGGGMHGVGQHDDAATRLAATKTELKITSTQEPAWQAFEAVVRQQAEARQALHAGMQARMRDPAGAASVDHAAQHETMTKQHESDQAARDKARQALFAVLSPEQKALAEQRLGAGAGRRMGGGHRHAS